MNPSSTHPRTPEAHAVTAWASAALLLLTLASTLTPPTSADEPTLDDLLHLTPPEASPPSEEPPSAPPPADSQTPSPDPRLPDALDRQLENPDPADAFVTAVEEMARAAAMLDEPDTGLDTQRLQQRILDRLDQVVQAATQQQSQSSSQSQARNTDAQQNANPPPPQPGQGQQPSQANANTTSQGQFAPGQVGPVEPGTRNIEELRREWGNLPPRLRDALSDGLDEPYSNLYRNLTEQYYQRLAEQAQ